MGPKEPTEVVNGVDVDDGRPANDSDEEDMKLMSVKAVEDLDSAPGLATWMPKLVTAEEIRSAHKISSKIIAKGLWRIMLRMKTPVFRGGPDSSISEMLKQRTTKPRRVTYSLPADIRVLRGDGEVYLLMVLKGSEWRMVDGGVHVDPAKSGTGEGRRLRYLGSGTGLSKKHHGSTKIEGASRRSLASEDGGWGKEEERRRSKALLLEDSKYKHVWRYGKSSSGGRLCYTDNLLQHVRNLHLDCQQSTPGSSHPPLVLTPPGQRRGPKRALGCGKHWQDTLEPCPGRLSEQVSELLNVADFQVSSKFNSKFLGFASDKKIWQTAAERWRMRADAGGPGQTGFSLGITSRDLARPVEASARSVEVTSHNLWRWSSTDLSGPLQNPVPASRSEIGLKSAIP
ncbi:hypothetical protein DFH07DRAFT_781005 [Mycena maculata]|uniref:Uncharacterized protein n=1 Tax=Mycena maculata TaxID=230809 RepID=A0AAD7I0E3_9AGAR|nr:hypothetical protein DFH07DRAFT_781005 [Mycena maculata]